MKDFQAGRRQKKRVLSSPIIEGKRIPNNTILVFLKSIFFFASIIIFLLSSGNLFFKQKEITKEEDVNISGNGLIPDKILLEDMKIGEGSYYDLDIYEFNVNLLKHPWIDKVDSKIIYPNQIIVAVTEKEPLAFFRIPKNIYLIDKYLRILPVIFNDDGWNLPVITDLSIKGSINPGEQVNYPSLMSATKILGQVGNKYLVDPNMISEIDITDSFNLQIRGMDKYPIIYLGFEDFENKFKNLYYAFPEIAKLNRFKIIDLRYKNKVIVK